MSSVNDRIEYQVVTNLGPCGRRQADCLFEQYVEVMDQLHDNFSITHDSFLKLLNDSHTLLVFVTLKATNALVSTAQASLILDEVLPRAMINNVVTHEHSRGQGYGRVAMDYLEKAILETWAQKGKYFRLFLTNNPTKGNADFYCSLLYGPLTPPDAPEGYTVMWAKDI